MLTDKDLHWWGPNPLVLSWINQKIAPDARVLDVGPGHAPFLRANEFIDFRDPSEFNFPENDVAHRAFYKADLCTDLLPFEDKSIDFIYCRHTVEDMWNPFHLLKEMERVGKAGYIETPSPFAELARGQDTQILHYRGYHHHRWLSWVHGGTLTLMSKFSVLEHVYIDDEAIDSVLRLGPYYWNNHYYWEDTIKWKHLQCPQDYDIPKDYPRIISEASLACQASCSEFFKQIFEFAANSERLACHTTS